MPKPNPLWQPEPPAILRYGGAVLLVAAVLIIALWLAPYLRGARLLPFFCAVVLSAWLGGTGPGLLATLLSVLAIDYYFVPPTHSLRPELEEIPPLVIFGFSALLVSWLNAVQRRTAHSLKDAYDELDRKVRELERANQALQRESGERERTQEALHQNQAELARITRVTTLGALTAAIAHEVNQPLAAVVTNASASLRWLAGQPPMLDEARRALERIISDGKRASEVIGRVRALVRKSPVRRDWMDINEIVLEVIALTRAEANRNRVSVQTRLADDMPRLLGDRVQLQQVTLNLIINAIEAINGMSEGPRELLVATEKDGSAGVLVAVTDSGPGLDPARLEHVFDTFYTTKSDGMGIGLAISRSIIEAHGGRLWATPNPHRGATFQFFLPAGGQEP